MTKNQKTSEADRLIENVLKRISDRIVTPDDLNWVLDEIDKVKAEQVRLAEWIRETEKRIEARRPQAVTVTAGMDADALFDALKDNRRRW